MAADPVDARPRAGARRLTQSISYKYGRQLQLYFANQLRGSKIRATQDVRTLAHDLAQEVYEHLMTAPIEDESVVRNPVAYMYRVASRVLIDHLRRTDRTPAPLNLDELDEDDRPQDDPHQHLHDAQQIHHALSQLTPKCREVFLLLMKGMTYRQVADELDISLPTVRYHVLNGYATLREVVDNKLR